MRRDVRHLLRRPEAADAPAIDLDVADTAIFDQMLGHEAVVRRLAARRPDRPRPLAERAIGVVGGAVEGLLEEGDAIALHRVEPQRGGFDILAEDLARVDQQDALGAETFARRVDMEDVVGERLAEGRPAEFRRPETRLADLRRRGPASPPGRPPNSTEA